MNIYLNSSEASSTAGESIFRFFSAGIEVVRGSFREAVVEEILNESSRIPYTTHDPS